MLSDNLFCFFPVQRRSLLAGNKHALDFKNVGGCPGDFFSGKHTIPPFSWLYKRLGIVLLFLSALSFSVPAQISSSAAFPRAPAFQAWQFPFAAFRALRRQAACPAFEPAEATRLRCAKRRRPTLCPEKSITQNKRYLLHEMSAISTRYRLALRPRFFFLPVQDVIVALRTWTVMEKEKPCFLRPNMLK